MKPARPTPKTEAQKAFDIVMAIMGMDDPHGPHMTRPRTAIVDRAVQILQNHIYPPPPGESAEATPASPRPTRPPGVGRDPTENDWDKRDTLERIDDELSSKPPPPTPPLITVPPPSDGHMEGSPRERGIPPKPTHGGRPDQPSPPTREPGEPPPSPDGPDDNVHPGDLDGTEEG